MVGKSKKSLFSLKQPENVKKLPIFLDRFGQSQYYKANKFSLSGFFFHNLPSISIKNVAIFDFFGYKLQYLPMMLRKNNFFLFSGPNFCERFVKDNQNFSSKAHYYYRQK